MNLLRFLFILHCSLLNRRCVKAKLAQTHQLTAYDAAYLAVARRFQLPLATLEEEFITAAHAAGVRLIQ